MDNYKDLLVEIFKNTIKDSIKLGRFEYTGNSFDLTEFTIKFTHLNEPDDKTYEKIKLLIENIKKDLTERNK